MTQILKEAEVKNKLEEIKEYQRHLRLNIYFGDEEEKVRFTDKLKQAREELAMMLA